MVSNDVITVGSLTISWLLGLVLRRPTTRCSTVVRTVKNRRTLNFPTPPGGVPAAPDRLFNSGDGWSNNERIQPIGGFDHRLLMIVNCWSLAVGNQSLVDCCGWLIVACWSLVTIIMVDLLAGKIVGALYAWTTANHVAFLACCWFLSPWESNCHSPSWTTAIVNHHSINYSYSFYHL